MISVFGEMRDGEGKARDYPHMGVDVWGNPHDRVLAAADGRVVTVAEAPVLAYAATCGKYIVIEHDEEALVGDRRIAASTKYCHLAEQAVAEGSIVKRGQVIGSVGTTGWRRQPMQTTGYEHVHWELLFLRGVVDPLPLTVGCFDPKHTYPTDKLVLTYPVKC